MVRPEQDLDEITGEVVDAAYKLHNGIGPGLLESVYEVVLARELERRGLRVARQQPVSFDYDGLPSATASAPICSSNRES